MSRTPGKIHHTSLLIVGLMLILTFACQPPTPLNKAKVAACVDEKVELIKPGWQVAWSANTEDGYIQLPLFATRDYAIVVDRLIASPNQKRIRAYAVQSGEEVWSSSIDNIGSPGRQTFLVTDKYIATYAGNVTTILYTESGEVALQLGSSGLPGPTSVFTLALDEKNDRLYVHDFSGYFRAYNLGTKEMVWERQMQEAMRASNLFVTNGHLVVSLLSGLWILDVENGQTTAQFPIRKLADGHLYETTLLVGQDRSSLRAVSVKTGDIEWIKKCNPFILYEAPAYYDGVLYFPGGDRGIEGAHEILAVELETGDLVRKYNIEKDVGVLSGIAVMENTGYAVLSDGTLQSFDLRSGQMGPVLRSSALYYWGTDDAAVFSIPSVVTREGYVLVSFGCSTLYALQGP